MLTEDDFAVHFGANAGAYHGAAKAALERVGAPFDAAKLRTYVSSERDFRTVVEVSSVTPDGREFVWAEIATET